MILLFEEFTVGRALKLLLIYILILFYLCTTLISNVRVACRTALECCCPIYTQRQSVWEEVISLHPDLKSLISQKSRTGIAKCCSSGTS